MIFKPELAKLVKQGRKTMTRRRVVPGVPCRYEEGKSYAVQPGRGQMSICRLTVTSVREEPWSAISIADARKEGFRARTEFFDYVRGLYGEGFDFDQPCHVIAFALGDRTDRPTLLAAKPGAPHGDYVHDPAHAMKGEGEAVVGTTLERYAKEGQERHAPVLAEQRAQRQAFEEKAQAYRDRLLTAVEEIRRHATSKKDRDRLRAVEHHLRELGREERLAA